MKLSTRDRALLGGVAAILVLAAFYMLALRPEQKQAARLGRSIATAQQQLAAAQAKYASGRQAQQQLNDNRPDYLAAERAVPATPNIPALLKLLQHKAQAAHVSIQTISLSGSGSGSTGSAAPATTPTTDGASTVSVPVSLTIGGGYQALNRMVRALDELVFVTHGHLRVHGPLVGIASVSLSPGNSTGTAAASGLTVQLSATIYQRAAATSATGSTTGASSSGATPGGSS